MYFVWIQKEYLNWTAGKRAPGVRTRTRILDVPKGKHSRSATTHLRKNQHIHLLSKVTFFIYFTKTSTKFWRWEFVESFYLSSIWFCYFLYRFVCSFLPIFFPSLLNIFVHATLAAMAIPVQLLGRNLNGFQNRHGVFYETSHDS